MTVTLSNEFHQAMHMRATDSKWVMPDSTMAMVLAACVDAANTARETYVKLRLIEMGIDSD